MMRDRKTQKSKTHKFWRLTTRVETGNINTIGAAINQLLATPA
jgi:hypothetical protein